MCFPGYFGKRNKVPRIGKKSFVLVIIRFSQNLMSTGNTELKVKSR